MKKIPNLALIFVLGIFVLLFAGCNGHGDSFFGCDTLTVEEFEKNGDSCNSDYTYTGETELSGLHIKNGCIDCYWFPTACGSFENNLSGIEVSDVRCGFDCTLGECYGEEVYGDKRIEIVPNVESRQTVTAIENTHYTIDKLSASVYYGELKSFTDDKFTLDDISSLIGLISMLGEDAEIQITLEYTALTEFHSATFSGDVSYDGYEWTNYTNYFNVTEGNQSLNEYYKADNIQPGKHIINAVLSLNFYELKDLEDITNLVFSAYTYGEE